MSWKLSHTQKNLYLQCPRAYFVKYVLRMSRTKTSSALPFGAAFDEALNVLLETKDMKAAEKTFLLKWTTPIINNVEISPLDPNQIHYYKSDTDPELFLDGETITPWESLKRKGLMFLESYNKEVIPKIKRVLSVQEDVEIENNLGDKIGGKTDLVVEWEDGRIIILDNKTSSKPYKSDQVKTEGGQLALYHMAIGEQHKATHVGYVVMNKKIKSAGPRSQGIEVTIPGTDKKAKVGIQILIDEVPIELFDQTVEEFDGVLHNIKMANFDSKHPNCTQPWDFEPCVCQTYNPDDYTGFIYLGRKDEQKKTQESPEKSKTKTANKTSSRNTTNIL